MRLSVVVPVYNAEAYLPRFLRAMAAQQDPGFPCEIIAVDDGSTDGSAGILDAVPGVRVITGAQRGPYAARNAGLEEASGTAVVFTDPDCAPAPDWLRHVAGALTDPDVGVVLGHTAPGRATRLLTLLDHYEVAKERYVFASGDPTLVFARANNMAVRRSLIDAPFDERDRGSDVLLVRRLVDRHSLGILRYRPEMSVRHLEITSPAEHLAKYRVYGTSFSLYSRVVPCRALDGRERLRVFRDAVDRNGLSMVDEALLFGLLAWGRLLWGVGALRGRLLRREPDFYEVENVVG